jgi:HTH-type transcriptional regulator, sugar sensing transcriptional regulator
MLNWTSIMTSSRSLSITELEELGLTPQEARVYVELLQKGSLPISTLARSIGVLPNALYRNLRRLEKIGLVVGKKTRPVAYWAVQPEVALERLVQDEKNRLERLKVQTLEKLQPSPSKVIQNSIELLPGRDLFFNAYIELTEEAQDEVLIISVGEPVSDDILLANRDATERGVKIKIIYHRYDESNREMIHRYLKMGWEVRHYPDWGFHLIVIDGKKALLAVNNPETTDERVGMMVRSEGMAKAMRDYFYSVWEKALVIR